MRRRMPAPDRLYYEMAMIRSKTGSSGVCPTIPFVDGECKGCRPCLLGRYLAGLGSGVLTNPIRFMPAREASAMTCASTS